MALHLSCDDCGQTINKSKAPWTTGWLEKVDGRLCPALRHIRDYCSAECTAVAALKRLSDDERRSVIEKVEDWSVLQRVV